ncbi:MAG: tripartite tricarboxylate transporter TctB family protein [Pseudomonadota bacterium]
MHQVIAYLRHPTRCGALLLLLFSFSYGWLARDIPALPGAAGQLFTAGTLPHFLSAAGVILASLLLIVPGQRATGLSFAQLRTLRWGRLAGCLALMIAYGWSLRPLGFLLSSALFLSGGFALLGERRWLRVLILASSTSLLFWLLMSWLLQVHLQPWPAFVQVD